MAKYTAELKKVQAFQRHQDKATSFQQEIDKALAACATLDPSTQLQHELKRQYFMELRDSNYRASLQLEGLKPVETSPLTTLESIKAKYAG